MMHVSDLPCDGDSICMICKETPAEGESLTCKTCVTPWHVKCLSVKPETLPDTVQWECPDCSLVVGGDSLPTMVGSRRGGVSESFGDLVSEIRAIELDKSLSEKEKAKRRQELMSGSSKSAATNDAGDEKRKGGGGNEVLDILDGSLNCSFCMQLPERPVKTPCGHNFCLKCFQKWVGQGRHTCANCRNTIPQKMASQP